MENRLYVGNLSYSTSDTDLQALFAKAGAVKSVTLITDRDTGRSKGFAFVEMGSEAEAQKAISMFNGTQYADRTLTVNLARPREDRMGGGGPGGPGGPGGRRGGSSRPGGRSGGRERRY